MTLLFPEIHPVQVAILSTLSHLSQATFAQLNVQKIETDWFSYHLKKVVHEGWVIKNSDKSYILSPDGKKLALQFDSQTHAVNRSQRVSVQVVAIHDGQYWIQHRQVEPYKGVWEFPTMRVRFGESPLQTVERALSEEAGMSGVIAFRGINHKVELTESGTLFDDKYLLVFEVNDLKGELNQEFSGGTNHWLSKKKLLEKEPLHFNLQETFEVVEQNHLLTEVKGVSAGY